MRTLFEYSVREFQIIPLATSLKPADLKENYISVLIFSSCCRVMEILASFNKMHI